MFRMNGISRCHDAAWAQLIRECRTHILLMAKSMYAFDLIFVLMLTIVHKFEDAMKLLIL
ncbi:MAG: hypothetical protein COB83_00860 [Gammaproteobacteria bacterium]|nr:MAG: hypothetical protein COB83_02805 [Gammaproteobacteria bacterium]PCH97731.1 MAG: hypothetical protein COB83_00860 [Gammaproteobacteria bacterium]